MKFTKDLVDTLADKLLIGLSDEENELVLKEFDIIDKEMDIIAKYPDIEKVEPMTHALDDFTYLLREDVAEDSVPVEELLANSGDVEDRQIKVPRVVG